jgi:hypothetical protein
MVEAFLTALETAMPKMLFGGSGEWPDPVKAVQELAQAARNSSRRNWSKKSKTSPPHWRPEQGVQQGEKLRLALKSKTRSARSGFFVYRILAGSIELQTGCV